MSGWHRDRKTKIYTLTGPRSYNTLCTCGWFSETCHGSDFICSLMSNTKWITSTTHTSYILVTATSVTCCSEQVAADKHLKSTLYSKKYEIVQKLQKKKKNSFPANLVTTTKPEFPLPLIHTFPCKRWKSASAGRCRPHCVASSSQLPFVCWDLVHHKTTSMLLFADLVNHKVHLSAFMWETELAFAGCPNNGWKCWSRGHSPWGKHYGYHAAQVTEP